MTEFEDKDIIRLKELLRRSSEFIAYFEVVERKMITWQHDLEEKTHVHQAHYKQQTQSIQRELESLHEILSQTGMSKFHSSIADILAQGEKQLQSVHENGEQLIKQMQSQLVQFTEMSQQSLQLIEQHSQDSIKTVNQALTQCDLQQFNRIANESCSHIERFAQKAVQKTSYFFQSFQWKILTLAIVASLLTSFITGLYVNDESPLETHQQAKNERQAGKLLLEAWPQLSHEEKVKILKQETRPHG